ncbi:Rhs [Geobacillus thermoleovorans CCB_US3_UF5]|uniref:Rhs n=1 Tax=Geobacillus thermoleovorans CCB_US3_UF5 TaxID=1111068 RepID=A0ABM5MLL0_GEOTH|nr:RHS repeat-associated core domain-containing protein [Geobacillus thermoleovorans]AEV20708.1 Rhs [Geobacillus thermoleovorans CCB_US3_UF5]QDY74567.1 hypothetical protein FP515_16310 [Geobacillus thermoleovorans]
MTKGGATYYYHVNGHGDVVALTDASGNVVAQYEYDAWGNILSKTGAMATANPYRYAGYYYDGETGLYYLMARYYEANVGRFLTRDTVDGIEDDPQSWNQYAYAKNDPIQYIDPNGHWSWKASMKSSFHRIVKSLADDFRANTLTNIAFLFFGGAIGGGIAYKAAKYGFTMFERYVLKKSIIGFIKRGIGGYLLGEAGGIATKLMTAGNKLLNYEGWFDSIPVGRSIDNAITRVEKKLHNLIDTW